MVPHLPSPAALPESPPGRRKRRAAVLTRNALGLLLLVSLPLQGSISGVSSAAAPTAVPALPDGSPAASTRAAREAKVSLRLVKAHVTTGQRAQAKVRVAPQTSRQTGTSVRQGAPGRVKVVVKGPGKSHFLTARLVDQKALIRLPRLGKGVYRVRATFLGTQAFGKAKSPSRALRVVRAGAATSTGWPGPDNTGVPAGTTLTNYSGPCTIRTAGTVIDSKTINCTELLIAASGVVIRKSKLRRVVVDTDVNGSWSLTLTDSEVDGGGSDWSAISNGNVTIVRADIHGGHNGLECQEHSSHCAIRDSWIHDQWQPPSGDVHLGGLLALGNQVPCNGTGGACVEIVHNTIVCDAPVNGDGGGCTGDINLLPHWGPLTGAIVRGNYLGANAGAAYCTYGGAGMEHPATNIVYEDNVFERGTNRKCAAYGPVTSFDRSARGNVWSNNRWDDGTPVAAAR